MDEKVKGSMREMAYQVVEREKAGVLGQEVGAELRPAEGEQHPRERQAVF